MSNNIKRILKFNVGVNLGNQDTKCVSYEGADIFSSLATYNHVGGISFGAGLDSEDSNVIIINGIKCLVGIGEPSYASFEYRSVDEIRTLGLYAISRQLQKRADIDSYSIAEVYMCAGLPIKEFRNQKNHEKLKKIFSGDIEVEYMNIKITVRFKSDAYQDSSILVVPEGMAMYAAFSEEKGYMNFRKILLLDAGSLTLDYVSLKNGTVFDADSISGSGTISLMDNIRKREGSIARLENIEIDTILKEGFLKVSGINYKKEQFDLEINAYAEKVHRLIVQKFGNLSDFDKIIIIGGGAYLIDNFFKSQYSSDILDIPANAEFSNANAYYRLSYMQS